ncbi:hypothetical protein LCGC14_0992560 [marine sediment metagenome]|uniref:SAP domain-containing protein n=1 Tax=marine sediment metagenome TaxID=412755 RepID=A0A0F9NRY8_9ZZZZ
MLCNLITMRQELTEVFIYSPDEHISSKRTTEVSNMANDKETKNLMARLEKLEQKETQNAKEVARLKAANEDLRKNQKKGKASEFLTGKQETIENLVITERKTIFENGQSETISFQDQYKDKAGNPKTGRGSRISREHLGELISFLQEVFENGGTYESETSGDTANFDGFMKLTKKEIQELCETKGLPTTGTKTDLSKRLTNGNTAAPSPEMAASIAGQLGNMSAADLIALVARANQ